MEGNHAIWKDFLPRTWISYHIPGFPTTYLFFLPHTLVGLDVAVVHGYEVVLDGGDALGTLGCAPVLL